MTFTAEFQNIKREPGRKFVIFQKAISKSGCVSLLVLIQIYILKVLMYFEVLELCSHFALCLSRTPSILNKDPTDKKPKNEKSSVSLKHEFDPTGKETQTHIYSFLSFSSVLMN